MSGKSDIDAKRKGIIVYVLNEKDGLRTVLIATINGLIEEVVPIECKLGDVIDYVCERNGPYLSIPVVTANPTHYELNTDEIAGSLVVTYSEHIGNNIELTNDPMLLDHPILNKVCVAKTSDFKPSDDIKLIVMYVNNEVLSNANCYFLALGWIDSNGGWNKFNLNLLFSSEDDRTFPDEVYNIYRQKFGSMRSNFAPKKVNADCPETSGFKQGKNLVSSPQTVSANSQSKKLPRSESPDFVSDAEEPEVISNMFDMGKTPLEKEDSEMTAVFQIGSEKGKAVHEALIKSETEKEKILPRATLVLESMADEILNQTRSSHSKQSSLRGRGGCYVGQRECNLSSPIPNRESRPTRGQHHGQSSTRQMTPKCDENPFPSRRQSSTRQMTPEFDENRSKQNLASKTNAIPLKPPNDSSDSNDEHKKFGKLKPEKSRKMPGHAPFNKDDFAVEEYEEMFDYENDKEEYDQPIVEEPQDRDDEHPQYNQARGQRREDYDNSYERQNNYGRSEYSNQRRFEEPRGQQNDRRSSNQRSYNQEYSGYHDESQSFRSGNPRNYNDGGYSQGEFGGRNRQNNWDENPNYGYQPQNYSNDWNTQQESYPNYGRQQWNDERPPQYFNREPAPKTRSYRDQLDQVVDDMSEWDAKNALKTLFALKLVNSNQMPRQLLAIGSSDMQQGDYDQIRSNQSRSYQGQSEQYYRNDCNQSRPVFRNDSYHGQSDRNQSRFVPPSNSYHGQSEQYDNNFGNRFHSIARNNSQQSRFANPRPYRPSDDRLMNGEVIDDYQNLMSNTRAPAVEKRNAFNMNDEESAEQKQRRREQLKVITKPNRPQQPTNMNRPVQQMPSHSPEPNYATNRPKVKSNSENPNHTKFTAGDFKNASDSESNDSEDEVTSEGKLQSSNSSIGSVNQQIPSPSTSKRSRPPFVPTKTHRPSKTINTPHGPVREKVPFYSSGSESD